MRAGIGSVSINPGAAVFTCKLVASIKQRIMFEKALGQFKAEPTGTFTTPMRVNFLNNAFSQRALCFIRLIA
jgi:hypothetical protein